MPWPTAWTVGAREGAVRSRPICSPVATSSVKFTTIHMLSTTVTSPARESASITSRKPS